MGRLYIEYLEGDNIYTCQKCHVHLTSYNQLISKGFRGRTGKAYLFNVVVNVSQGPSEDRVLLTGLHTVCDIFCKGCSTVIGWKYDKAFEEQQKYKEGKYILERHYLKKEYWTI